MTREKKPASAVTFETALPAIEDHFFSEAFGAFFHHYRALPDKERRDLWRRREAVLSQAHAAWRKLRTESFKSLRLATSRAEQWQEVKKLWRFYRNAKYGPALSMSWKRTRAALLLGCYRRLSFLSQPIDGLPPLGFDSFRYLEPILDAARTDNDQFWEDLKVASRFRRNQSRVNCFLAEYSLLMLGKRPTLTFGELHKILHWIEPKDLRRQIGRIRKRYGRLAVPLRPGRPGRPKIDGKHLPLPSILRVR